MMKNGIIIIIINCVIHLLLLFFFFLFSSSIYLSCQGVQAENSHPFQAFRGGHGGNALRGRRRWRIHSLRQPEACTGNHGERRFAKPRGGPEGGARPGKCYSVHELVDGTQPTVHTLPGYVLHL